MKTGIVVLRELERVAYGGKMKYFFGLSFFADSGEGVRIANVNMKVVYRRKGARFVSINTDDPATMRYKMRGEVFADKAVDAGDKGSRES